MTTNKTNMALAELAEKGADVDLLREMIQFVAQQLMDMDVGGLCAPATANARPSGSTIATAKPGEPEAQDK